MPPCAVLRCIIPGLSSLLLLPLPGLAQAAPEAVPSYRESIQPLLNQKCVACHACYDAPCQLNLGSSEGVRRGSTQLKVYDSKRTRTQAPTRLFTDAQDAGEWRRKGFSSVLESQGPATETLLGSMLALGRQHKLQPGRKLPADIPVGIDAIHACPQDAVEFAQFRQKYPHRGMPLGVTGLTDSEYRTITAWLAAGAPIDDRPPQLLPQEIDQLAEWEALLNPEGAREQLVARWLYEHLFLAHLYFDNVAEGNFFELVRSRTPSGQPIDLIATAQPNHPPGSARIYYRLRPLQGAIVHKTHITYALGAQKMERIRTLFFDSDWAAGPVPAYDEAARANPFTTFAAIPARARYQFMLDNAEYFVRTFIRGPVCRGSIATDVIRDHFWLLFQAPERDLYVTSAAHRSRADALLGLPGQRSGLADLPSQWATYTRLRNQYSAVRADDYARAQPDGAALTDIWLGEGRNRDALLTIVRHHDSASVTRGLAGPLPQTLWWMDFPLLERTYYSLVVNFNVFDTVSHQAQTRLYFDLIRHGAETNFLRLMPPGSRQALIDDWYQSSGKLKVWLYYPKTDTSRPVAIPYRTDTPRQEFVDRLRVRMGDLARQDPLNGCTNLLCYRPGIPLFLRVSDHALSRLTHDTAATLPVILQLPEATLLRVQAPDGQREVYTLLRNRAHSNVAYMAGETLRHQPQKDRLMVYPGLLTSYPNFAFDIPAGEISLFADALLAARGTADFTAIVERWGIRRTHPDFWRLFNDFTAWQRERDPREAGILDMSRYGNL
ncbi:MAG: cti [Moraxellaceae bacterium]|nr:cti [Moraxellaceae bacterium]